jgi:hypothetical protein
MGSSIKSVGFFKSLTLLLFVLGSLMAFSAVAGEGIWFSSQVRIAETDDPFQNRLDIFEPEGIQVGSQIDPNVSDQGDTVTLLTNWEYTAFVGSSRR